MRPDLGGPGPVAVFLHEIASDAAGMPGAGTTPTDPPDRTARFDAASGRPHTPAQAMEDIVGVRLWLPRERLERAARVLERLGCTVTALASGVRVTGRGPSSTSSPTARSGTAPSRSRSRCRPRDPACASPTARSRP